MATKIRSHLRPVKEPPTSRQLDKFLSLFEIAYCIWIASGKAFEVTVVAVSGAVRALKLKEDSNKYATIVRGGIIFRQQTMVHKSFLPAIQKYLEGKQDP